ncbi:sodium/glucose cotransporter 1 [Plakobranchus ocellatus]|uniref:Sodium/glucose cotransporter 1 n=1 Tax=Plakobranchus ocellatus TaxID=259542 RepID=A0AAV3ZW78_9GAST|nr:sodium/glucose cotransporter 1 [Plakobranchus ocellatus]
MTSWNVFRPHYTKELPWPGMVFGITINSLYYFCCSQFKTTVHLHTPQHVVQNALGSKDIVQAKYACIVCAYGKILTIMFMVLPGIVARIRGLVLAALLACGVTTLCSSLNSVSTIFTLNIYRNFRPAISEMELIIVTRASAVVMGILSLAVVPVVRTSPLLSDYMNNITATFVPPILAVFLCGLFWERASEESAFRALLLGLALALVRLIWRQFFSSEICGEVQKNPAPQILSNFHFLHFSIFVFVLCTAYIAVAGIFSEPINQVHLYRLLYWLRHSRLDRVDQDELDEAFQQMKTTQMEEEEKETRGRTFSHNTLLSDSVDAKQDEVPQAGSEDEAAEEEDAEEAAEDQTAEPVGWMRNLKAKIRCMCCIKEEVEQRMVTNNELRETVKQRADIRESQIQESVLNSHALLLFLVTAVIWGFLA